MKTKIDFTVIDGGDVVTLKPVTRRAKRWLLEAMEVADYYYTGGPLQCEREMAQELLGSAEQAYFHIETLDENGQQQHDIF